MDEVSKILLVEGVDDAHAVRNVGYENGVSIHIEKDEFDGDIVIKPADGNTNLASMITEHLDLGTVQALGVVADADDDAQASFQSACEHLLQHGDASYEDARSEWTSGGWVGRAKTILEEPVRVGVWVMPDNDHPGALEDFAADLIPEGDELWTYAGSVIDDLPERRFKRSHEGKARMHTYLAWQDPPREPIGRSITSDDGPLQHDSKLAHQFVAWLRTLYPNG